MKKLSEYLITEEQVKNWEDDKQYMSELVLKLENALAEEIDFVVMNEDRKIYIQVCDDLSSEQTQSREKAPLLSIRDAYPKMIIARTKHESYDIDGIRVVDIARWLRGDES